MMYSMYQFKIYSKCSCYIKYCDINVRFYEQKAFRGNSYLNFIMEVFDITIGIYYF